MSLRMISPMNSIRRLIAFGRSIRIDAWIDALMRTAFMI
jgi:hypothetical protein